MPDTTIIFIHGLWMTGADMAILRSRFTRSDYLLKHFRYPSTQVTPTIAAGALSDMLETLPNGVVHFVCHSLGGLVLRHFFHGFAHRFSGTCFSRVVTLGTPHQGNFIARKMNQMSLGRRLLGKSLKQGLIGGAPSWEGYCELGSIAGTFPLGLGGLPPFSSSPNDGTVLVEETYLAGMKDHIELSTSHIGLLFSRQVFRQANHFLEEGSFIH